MESYMLVLYVTLHQEEAIRHLFHQHGWKYIKEDANIAVLGDLGGSKTDLSYTDGIIGSREEGYIHLEISCIEDEDNRKCSFSETQTLRDVEDNNREADNTGSHGNTCSNDSLNRSVVNDIGVDDAVATLHDRCTIDIHKNSLYENVNDNKSVTQDHLVQNTCSNNNLNSRMQDNTVSENVHIIDNDATDTVDGKCDKEGEHVQPSEEEDQSSREQLKSLISRGKLLSIENKRRLSSEQKPLVSSQQKLLVKSNSRRKKRYDYSSNLKKKRPIFCSDCKVTFTSQRRYDTHKARNNGKCVFECKFCDKIFLYRKSRYDLHVLSAHSTERPFKCDVCQKGYVTSDKLKIHKRVHTGEKPCVCEECGKTFYSRGDLSTHREYHHISKERQDNLTCDMCNMTFCNQRYLAYHKNVTHSTRRDFHCQICSKSFKSNSSLRRHLKYIHSDSKDFKCDTCDKSFKTAGSLKKHKVRHIGERTFFCSECNKGFYEKAKLDQHHRTHTGEKPYRCHLCEYRCALSGNLSKHMKTHYRELTNAVI